MREKLNVIEKRISIITISLAVLLILLLTVRNMQLEYQLELNKLEYQLESNKDELVNTRNELNGEKFFNQAQENGQWVKFE